MKLRDLTKDIREMSDDDLHAHIRSIRHNRETVRLGKQAHAKREAKRESNTAAKNISVRLDQLSPEQREALLSQLEGMDDE